MPLRVICTSPENPLSDCTPTWIPALVVPWLTVVEEGEMLRAKSGEGGGGETSPVVPPPQPAQRTPTTIAQQAAANRQTLLCVMRSVRSQFCVAALPSWRCPWPRRSTTPWPGGSPSSGTITYRMANLEGLIKISNINGKWRERLKKQTARKQLRAVVTQGRLK